MILSKNYCTFCWRRRLPHGPEVLHVGPILYALRWIKNNPTYSSPSCFCARENVSEKLIVLLQPQYTFGRRKNWTCRASLSTPRRIRPNTFFRDAVRTYNSTDCLATLCLKGYFMFCKHSLNTKCLILMQISSRFAHSIDNRDQKVLHGVCFYTISFCWWCVSAIIMYGRIVWD